MFKIRLETNRFILAASKFESNLIEYSKYLIASFKFSIGSLLKLADLVDEISALVFCYIKMGYEYLDISSFDLSTANNK